MKYEMYIVCYFLKIKEPKQDFLRIREEMSTTAWKMIRQADTLRLKER